VTKNASNLLLKYRLQRSVLIATTSSSVAAVFYWAAKVDGANALATSGLAFAISCLISFRYAKPRAAIVGQISRESDPQAIARTVLSEFITLHSKQTLDVNLNWRAVRFNTPQQLYLMVGASLVLAAILQWQSYSPLTFTSAPQLNLTPEAVLGGDNQQSLERQHSNADSIKKITNQIAQDSRQYPRSEAALDANSIIGGSAYGNEKFVLQRYQLLTESNE
jgi:hypothetical protein